MSVKTVRIKQNIIRKRYLTNSQKAINIRNRGIEIASQQAAGRAARSYA